MKRTVWFPILFLAFVGRAQQFEKRKPIDPAQKAHSFLKELEDDIPLSPTQEDSLAVILKTYYQEVQANRLQKDAFALKAADDKRDAKVEKVLTNPVLYKRYRATLTKITSVHHN